MKKGLFISIEGSDGSGKSTQLKYIREYFRDRGLDALFTREPGGTPIGEKIRSIILDKHNGEMFPITEAMLYAAARAQHVRELILPALGEGRHVVCDRFVDSSIAYQGFGRELGQPVRVINDFAVDGCMPDYTFFLDLDPRVGRNRIRSDGFDRLEQEKLSFHRRVYEGYMDILKEPSGRFISIDASDTEERVRDVIYRHLNRIFSEEITSGGTASEERRDG